jgi:rubrerythrin
MATTPLGREALELAISSEIRARDLYTETARRVTNRGGKRRLERLARDEDGHRRDLESRYRALARAEFRFDPSSTGGPRLDFVSSEVFTQARALEIVSVAISAESEAIAFYGKQLQTVTDPQDVRLLRSLVKFEQGHKKRLQREYERLNKGLSWVG